MDKIERAAPKKVKPNTINVPATALRHTSVEWCNHGINKKYCQTCKDKAAKKTEPKT